jgi:hypothetical protein
MIVTFKTKAYANITMFGNVALRLLKLMGHSGSVPGAILADDVPAALQRLRAGVTAQADEPAPSPGSSEDNEKTEPQVNLAQRAFPLIELLEAAARDHEDVRWDR